MSEPECDEMTDKVSDTVHAPWDNSVPVRQAIFDLYPDLEFTFFDGLDAAIVGVVESYGSAPRICYDRGKCIDVFVEQGMDYDEACEYFDFNVACAFVGETTPAFIDLLDQDA